MSKPRLGYWKIRGLGAGIRQQLAYCGVDYEMEEYAQEGPPDFSREPWLKHKFNLGLDFPNLPYFIDGDLHLTETLAIHIYIADKWKPELLGSTPEERAFVNMLTGPLLDIKLGTTIPCYTGAVAAPIKKVINEKYPKIIEVLGDNTFLAGSSPTYIDFFFFECINMNKFVMPNLFKVFPRIETYWNAVRNLPGLKEYLDDPNCIDYQRQFNNTVAKINNNVHYTLHYFPLYAKGEPFRMMFTHAGVSFTDNVI